jgi:hypothetical protein
MHGGGGGGMRINASIIAIEQCKNKQTNQTNRITLCVRVCEQQ